MTNIKIRKALASKMMRHYQLDEILGISEATRCRMLRKELPDEEQERICKLIDEYVEAKQGGNE